MTKGLFSITDFPALLFVGFVSTVVRWLETLAVALFVYRLTDSAFAVALISMLRMLPMGLFGAFIGAAADRWDLRSALILAIAVSVANTLALALLASFGALEPWHLSVGAFVNGTCLAADNPVRRMMIGNVVGPARMGSAISFDVAISNASRVLGPTLAGLLLTRYEIASVFWLGVVFYAASLVAAFRMRKCAAAAGAHPAAVIAGIGEGFRWLRGDRRLVGVFMITVIFNLLAWPYTSMIPVIATEDFHLDPTGVGLIASCEGVGGLVGALLLASLARSEWYGRVYVGAVAIYFATMIGFAMAPVAPAAAVVLLLNGMSAVGFSVMQATLVYRDSPIEMRARLMGVLSVCIGTGPLGFMYLGFLADILTPRVATVALAGQGVLALVLTWRYWVAVLRP